MIFPSFLHFFRYFATSFAVIGFGWCLCQILYYYIPYHRSVYYKEKGIPFWRFMRRAEKGSLGEYFTSLCLERLPGNPRLLFNLYIPRPDGTTSEVDIVMLHVSGIYVIESKNYSGWIFGSEQDTYWTQTLSYTRKNAFYSPLRQNEGHIRWLQNHLAEKAGPFYSYIVFSDRCTLQKVLKTPGHVVLNRRNLRAAIKKNIKHAGKQMSPEKIDRLYDWLHPLSLASDAVKAEHIQNVQRLYGNFNRPAKGR